jgi:hypothetical protein
MQKYYFGFANDILWPLFHDLPSRCNFDPAHWDVYENVSEKWVNAFLRAGIAKNLSQFQRVELFLPKPSPKALQPKSPQ